MRRTWTALVMALVVMTLAQTVQAAEPTRESGTCLTREQAITLIAHKADIERPGIVSKWRVWAIADRESGLSHCDERGRVKVSRTADHGLLQLNERGVWLACDLNPHCREPWMIDDAAAQVDVMIAYAAKYGDLCPWNPDGDYRPGCGYK